MDETEGDGFSVLSGLAQLEVLNRPEPTLYLYRVLANDDDGDPLDHGVVMAENRETVRQMLKTRFTSLGLPQGLMVRLYKLESMEATDKPPFRVLDTEGLMAEVRV